MHKKAQVTKDETLSVASRSNGAEKEPIPAVVKTISESAQEEKFLSEVLAGYSFWNKQQGEKAKGYAEAYRLLLHKFTELEEKE